MTTQPPLMPSSRPTEPKPPEGRQGGRFPLYAALFLAAAAVAVYSNSLGAPFVFDDIENIAANPAVRMDRLDWHHLSRAAEGLLSSRPVANLSFAVNFYLHGYSVFGYHLVNTIIHAVNGVLLFLLLRRTLATARGRGGKSIRPGLKDEAAAALGALLWVVHPANTQAVSYVVQRMTILSAMFYMAAMLFFVYGRESEKSGGKVAWFVACGLCGILALGAKEIAVTLPFALILYEWFFYQNLDSRWIRKRAAWLLAALAVVLAAGWLYTGKNPAAMVQSFLAGYENRPFTPGERLLTQFRVVAFYISLVLFPHTSRLNLDHHVEISRSLTAPPTTLAALILIASLLILAALRARKNRLASFAVFWFFGNLVLESSIIPLELLFEHRLYLPSMMVWAMPAVFLIRSVRPVWLPAAVLLVCAGVFGLWTYQRNAVWADDLLLLSDSVKKSPQKARPHYGLASVLAQRGRLDEAIYHYRRALAIDPGLLRVKNALGSALAQKGRFAEAVAAFRDVIEADPGYAGAYYNLGKVYRSAGRPKQAARNFRKALEIQPRLAEAMVQLVWLLASDPDPAVRDGTEAVAWAKRLVNLVGVHQPAALDALAAALAEAGQYGQAAAVAKEAEHLAAKFDMDDLADGIGGRRRLYLSGRPFRAGGVP